MSDSRPTYTAVGSSRKLLEGREKVTGRARYAGDLRLPGMLHARPVLSPYAHARIVAIDAEAARQVPGVVAVLMAEDLPTRSRAMNSRHSAVLARERALWRGQPVAVVLAESEAAARDGADAVLVEYDPLPAAIDPLVAEDPSTPVIWPNGLPKEGVDLTAAHAAVNKDSGETERSASNIHTESHNGRGDVERGFAAADVIVERTYRCAIVHQSYMEPCASVAVPDPVGGGVTVYTGTQGQFMVRSELARLLGLPRNKVRVVPMTLGGGFGAKYGIVESLAAAAALVMERPVRVVLTRSEDFLTTTPSPSSVIALKIGARRDGTLTAIQARVTMDNGVFPFDLGGLVAIIIGGYYRCENVAIDGAEVLTNKPQMGSYRAPGAPQATFALESTIDDLARELGIDPLEFRLQNAAETGDSMGNNDPWPSMGLKLCLERLREHPAWREGRGSSTATPAPSAANIRRGVGIAVGGWPCAVNAAAAICRVDGDGIVRIHVGSMDVTGVNSTFTLVAAEVLGVSPDQVEIIQGDTETGPHAGPAGGSQTTYSVSAAVADAAREARRQLLEIAAEQLEVAPGDLEIVDGEVRVRGVPAGKKLTVARLAGIAQRKQGGPGPIVAQGRASVQENAPGFVAHLAEVEVDQDSGEVRVTRYVAVQDVGFALNPLLLEGQVHGGATQGISYGLYEAMVYDENGQLLTGSFMDYSLPTADRFPLIETVLVENPSPFGPFGARGMAEPPIIPGAAAVANAIRDAVGARVAETPMRGEAVWRAIRRTGV